MVENEESNCFKSGETETEIIIDAYFWLQLCTPPLKHLGLVIYVLKWPKATTIILQQNEISGSGLTCITVIGL